MAGNRFKNRNHGIRWKEGRYKGRRRVRNLRRSSKPNLLLEIVVAAIISVIATVIAFCLAFILLGSYRLPLHFGYGAVLAFIAVVSLIPGPRDRGGFLIAGGMSIFWIIGCLYLFSARDEVQLLPHRQVVPSAHAGVDRGAPP